MIGVVLLTAACGGDGPLTAREFRRDASRICRRGNARVQRVQVASIDDGVSAARGLQRVVDLERALVRTLRTLDPPKRDAMAVEKWLAVIDQLVDQAEQAQAAVEAGDAARARVSAGRALLLDERARALADRYGITPCRVRARALGL